MAQNAAEEHFETYLDSHSHTYRYELPAGAANPDYWVDHDTGPVVCEVRHVTASIGETIGNEFGSIDPYKPLAKAVKRKSRQGRALDGVHPYVVVLWAPDWDVGDLAVAGALFGRVGISFPVDTTTGTGDLGKASNRFGRDATLHPGTRSHISAVALLHRFNPTLRDAEDEISARLDVLGRDSIETGLPVIWDVFERRQNEGLFDPDARQPRLTVMHNPDATLPLPPDVLRGPYDEHWSDINGVYGPYWVGDLHHRLPG